MARLDHYQYLLLMAACFGGTLPLEFLFDARVWRRPGRLLRALVPVLVVFAAWDAVAIARHHWSFARRYVTGVRVPFSIPIEEIVFFVVIPVCALLTFESVSNILGRRTGRGVAEREAAER